ncbi:MAG: phospho-N-acetylmuramoyl-pentapeptide-transferase [Bacteroidetes bacterium HGW-Bacteroidetes-6]|jgi:phospho-N-acetylmuramoyl-pentapeptide-transferase|nr:MAG: phospho-N-acetylmuramoyl-pentapeptide-transferase [Bacteroidetes bacterium HGW-Bacteroidetes-6]
MLYYLFDFLNKQYDLPGAGAFQYISFRAAIAAVLSLLISMVFGKRIIRFLKNRQIGEEIRDLGLEGQAQKKGTPTMGGIIILAAILIPTLLLAKLHNTYIIVILISTVWLGTIGFIDDYIKVFKKNKAGLHGKFKILGQLGLGILVGTVMYFNDSIVIREKINATEHYTEADILNQDCKKEASDYFHVDEVKSLKTSIPFVKDNEFDYAVLTRWMGEDYQNWAWLIFIPIVMFIVVAVSNGANLTDGMDGLAAGTSAVVGLTLGLLAWVSGNFIFADYLNIMYIPNSGELTIYISAFVGAMIGFLWYNSFPAQVFMGDTGSLTIGGIIAVFAIMIRKELLIPVLCGVFMLESASVLIQVTVFKYRKKRFGYDYASAHRVFRMTPIHHHFHKKGLNEVKIVNRFIIVSIIMAIITIATLKLR